MIITINGHSQKNAVQNTALLFFPMSSFDFSVERNKDGRFVTSTLKIECGKAEAFTQIKDANKTTQTSLVTEFDDSFDEAAFVSQCVYEAGNKHTGLTPAWGTITGIRPAKFVRSQLDNGRTPEDIEKIYLVEPTKVKLCTDVLKSEKYTLGLLDKKSVSLYVSIPFCPSRCRYCSFVSHDIEKAGHLLAPYVDLLCKELELVAKLVNDTGVTVNTIYIGGGTPTTLSAKQLKQLMSQIASLFDTSKLLEYTVEAGRPDTITREKLETIKQYHATRISVNPQTINDKTLELIGRKHNSECFLKAFQLAREVGFKCINTDLIAGLDGESVDDFKHSIDTMLSLAPQNITVHTLAVKRAAYLRDHADDALAHSQRVAQMLEYSQKRLDLNSYKPYYLYRQKNMVGNLENVGYCLDSYEGLYNTYIMGEYQTIMAAGAGAVSKVVGNGGKDIQRIFNYKYPYEYIDNFQKTIDNVEKMKSLIEDTL